MRQLSSGSPFVDCRRADAEMLRDLANGEELLDPAVQFIRRTSRRWQQIGSKISGNRLIRWDVWAVVVPSVRGLTRVCEALATDAMLVHRLGCKWSPVQIQSPRPMEAPDLPDLVGTVRGLSFWGKGGWQQIGSKGRFFSEWDHWGRRSLRERAEVELHDGRAHVLDAVEVRVDRERGLDVGVAEDLLREG